MNSGTKLRKLGAYFAPGRGLVLTRSGARRQFRALIALLAVAAIAGAVVLTPSSTKPDAWDSLRKRIAGRAQVDLFDDFSAGLDSWNSGGNPARTWSYDGARFVSPGDLSLLAGSLGLTDYDVDLLFEIQSKGLGLALRASGPRDYQAARLLVEGPATAPVLVLERYTVVAGQSSPRTRVPVPGRFQPDTLYRLHAQVRGDSFTLYLQGRLVDYWSDARLRSGGVGLFCAGGEHARIAWIRVSRNTDGLGKFCSLLASFF